MPTDENKVPYEYIISNDYFDTPSTISQCLHFYIAIINVFFFLKLYVGVTHTKSFFNLTIFLVITVALHFHVNITLAFPFSTKMGNRLG